MTSYAILTVKFTGSIMCGFCILLTNKPIFNMQEVGDKIADITPKSFKRQKQATCQKVFMVGGGLFHTILKD